MNKERSVYACNSCGAQFPKWSGQCADCGDWNSLIETAWTKPSARVRPTHYSGEPAGLEITALNDVALEQSPRLQTGMNELDRVLGGGLVLGSVVLIGGDPGIGKSTLLAQTLAWMSTAHEVLYITGEESLQQVKLRAQRLGLALDRFHCLAETSLGRLLTLAHKARPAVMVIDSIQTTYTDALGSAPGSVSQVRECAAQLVQLAKRQNTAVFLVGHVTKEGTLAGPRVLEHMVDTVLYFEGDAGSRFRMIRAMKNRFGAVNELGVFAMTDRGLKEVSNPSAIFLSRHENPAPGSAILVTLEGSRPLLVEVQALVDESHLPQPRRVTLGLDPQRLSMLLAVLHRHVGIVMYDQDVYVNVVGGVRVTETGADLAVILATYSSFRNRVLPRDLIVFGEIGLAGEVRPVPNGTERLKEAAKHGFKRAIVPIANCPKNNAIDGLQITGVARLADAIAEVDGA